jgi:5-methylcytosine-specific restriction endonuclease McrA
MSDPYYRTKEWKRLREAALLRDLFRCAVPGCRRRANVVDHILCRRNGGADVLDNLRCLCPEHDRQIKEDEAGKRRSGGQAFIRGADAKGIPLDAAHWWNKNK